MGRPKKQNPKCRHIGIVTTEEKFRRYKALGFKGDEAIDVLLHYRENKTQKLEIQRSQAILNIKNLKKKIEELEYEVLKEETRLEEINEKMGLDKKTGYNEKVSSCIGIVLQRYDRLQDMYTIDDFLGLDKYAGLISFQAERCEMKEDEFKDLIRETVGSE